jgi:hypothetical protein
MSTLVPLSPVIILCCKLGQYHAVTLQVQTERLSAS